MTKPITLLEAIAKFAQENGIPLDAPDVIDKFVEFAKPQIIDALGDGPLLHGTRVQNLFEATVLSLGGYKVLKVEDGGRVHSDEKLRAPDFRIILKDGKQWLIEVKNVRCEDPHHQRTKMTGPYLSTLERYAGLMGVPLKIAFYWSRWNLWTLVSPDKFRATTGGLSVLMGDAMMASEMGQLGDVSIGTVAPLRMIFEADPGKPHLIHEDGNAEFTIGSVRLFGGTIELTAKNEQNLAWILLNYGEWEAQGPFAIEKDGVLLGLEFRAEPGAPSDQGFDFVGLASRMFARYFADVTTEGKRLTQLKGTPAPDWFAPLSQWDFKGSKLRLWLFHARPKG